VPFHFAAKETQPVESDKANRIEYVDPRFLSFDYTVNYSGLRKFSWIPRLVYDDGKKTYIVFPEQVLQQELPGVFENSSDIINYRVHGELVVIDKLIEKITVKYKNESITITKKRGS
jgi:type IV secretory pathway VirB9-like protein